MSEEKDDTPVDSETRRAKAFSTRMQALAALIASAAALITSVGSMVKSSDKSVEKKSYEELSSRVADLQDENKELREYQSVLHSRLMPAASTSAPQTTYPPPGAPSGASASTDRPVHISAKSRPSADVTERPPAAIRPPAPARPSMPPPPWSQIESGLKKLLI